MKNIKFQLAIAFVCVVLGLMLTTQFRAVKQGVGPVSEYRARELAAQVKDLKSEKEALLKVKNEYETKLRTYESTASEGSAVGRMLKQELDNARIIAGLEDVEGPGITVELNDGKFGEQNNYALITGSMILEVLNELNAAGAEAISINGQRIVSNSEVRQIGSGILININGERMAPPFTLKAIGNPEQLEAALRLRGGVAENIESMGVAVIINSSTNIKIGKFNGVIEKKYAKVVKKGATE